MAADAVLDEPYRASLVQATDGGATITASYPLPGYCTAR
jgi:hypothetical protein